MKLETQAFPDGGAIPAVHALTRPAARDHVSFAGNRNPDLAWSGVPSGTRSLALVCVDPDAPSVGEDVNQEDRPVPKDLPRAPFHHWVMVDIPPDCEGLAAGSCSDGVTPHGKQQPPGPPGSRQGVNDYSSWFTGDPGMEGTWRGYDGPSPPWNDERVHHYHFKLFALDLERCPVEGDFRAPEVLRAIEGHVLAEATLTGTYTQNPALGG